MRSWHRRLFIVLALAGLLAVVWLGRHRLGLGEAEPTVSQELADATVERLNTLEPGARAVLRTAELQSLLRFRWGRYIPEELDSVTVHLEGGRVTARARMAREPFLRVGALREIAGFLPDTLTLVAVGSLTELAPGQVAVEVHEMEAATLPLPRGVIPAILAPLRAPGDTLAPTVLAVTLPPPLATMYVDGDSLVVTVREGDG